MHSLNLQQIDKSQQIIDDLNSYESKFKKIDYTEGQDYDVAQTMEIYHDTIKKYQSLNQNIFRIQRFNNLSQLIQSPSGIKRDDLQEPSKLEVKLKINLEKKSSEISRAQSQHQSLIIQKQNPPSIRINVHTATRNPTKSADKFHYNSIKSEQNETTKTPTKYLSPQDAQYLSANSSYLHKPIQKSTTVNLSNKIRAKSTSIFNSSSKMKQQKKFKKCIPLEQFCVKQKESFLQSNYRKRRGQSPNWISGLMNWASSENIKRSKTIKMTLKPKEKIVFQTYDFDGQLIPSFYALQKKQKKFTQEIPKIEVRFFNDPSTQNKRKDNNVRKKTATKTIKQVKFQYPELIPVESEFLKNFQNLKWNPNIQLMEIQQGENKKGTSSMIQLLSSSKKLITHQPINNSIVPNLNKQIDQQGKSKLQQQEQLVSEFEIIKNNDSQQNQYSNNFQHSFSKYVKVKNIQQKQNKSKSCSYHQSDKNLTLLLQDEHSNYNQNQKSNQNQKASSPNNSRVIKKGPQKIRANKSLFKKIFNTSLKHIESECREDIATIKLINDIQKQNFGISEQQRQQKSKLSRNSDAIMFRKGFFVGQSLGDSKTDFSKFSKKSLNQSQNLIIKDSIKQISDKRHSQGSSANVSPRKKYFGNETKNVTNFEGKYEKKDLQKIFKKETKKIIFKHSANSSNRQSFQ